MMDKKADKRRQKRTRTRVLVKVDGKSGIISDFSETGLQISTNSLPSKKKVSIVFEVSGNHISLDGVIQWIRRKYSFQNSLLIGCSIEKAPIEYYKFVREH
jgi:hypothetical protein